jgi:hypothetical protein
VGKKKDSFLVVALALVAILVVWVITIAFYLALIGGAIWLVVNLVLKPLGFIA